MKNIKKVDKRNYKLSSADYYFRYTVLSAVAFLIILAGILLDRFWLQGIGTIILGCTPIYLFLFFKTQNEEEESTSEK
ncbi:MAG: hypothetical protein Q4C84_08435 [Bacillota bacterium]|nr:hypothetical protein [Bacillota bacterium]